MNKTTPRPALSPCRPVPRAFPPCLVAGVLATLLLASFAPRVHAQGVYSGTWTGAGADNNWSTGANWSDGVAPGTGSDIVFSGTARLQVNYDMPAETVYHRITFAPGAGEFYIYGTQELKLSRLTDFSRGNNVIVNETAHTQSIACPMYLTRANVGSGDFVITQPGGGSIALLGDKHYDNVWLFPSGNRGTLHVYGVGSGTGYYINETAWIMGQQWGIRNNVADSTIVVGNGMAFGDLGVHSNQHTFLQAGVELVGANALQSFVGLINNLTISGSHGFEIAGMVYQSNSSRTLAVTNTGTTQISGTLVLAANNVGYTLSFSVAPTAGRTLITGDIVNRLNDAEPATVSSFTKKGEGNLQLYGNNSYRGRTYVEPNGGGLYVNGSHLLVPFQPGDTFGSYDVGANSTLGGSGTIRPVAGPGTLTGVPRMQLANNSRLRAGDGAIPTTNNGVIVPEARALTLDHSEAKTQTLLNLAGTGVAMEFALGRQGTNTRVAVVGRAGIADTIASMKFATSHVVNFIDVADRKLDAGDYVLVSTDGDASTYSGLVVNAEGEITNLTIGAGLEYYTNIANYAGFKLMFINNCIVLRVLPPPAPVITNTQFELEIGQRSYLEYQMGATNLATSYTVEGALPDNVTIDEETGLISGTPTIVGAYPVAIKATNAGGTDSRTLTINVMPVTAPATITSSLAARPIKGEYFSYAIRGTNYPSDYAATGLPAWLTLSRNIISGNVPLDAPEGDMAVVIGAENDIGGDTKTLTLTVLPVLKAPVVTSALSANGVITKAFQYQITAANMPSSFGATGLPPGLTVNATTGLISGFPTRVGIYSVTLTARNGGGTGSAKLSITVTNVPGAGLVFYTPVTASGAIGQAFTFTVAADGTPPPSNYSATGLPPGLTMDSASGVISGTPSASGVFAITVTATADNGAITATSTLAITIHGNAALETEVPATAGFNYPTAAVMDAAGVMYIADTGNDSIKKVASNGAVTALATLPAAPLSLAIDAQGNLYAGATNGAIYKITSTGAVSTYSTGFTTPSGLAPGDDGVLYVADTGNNQIKAIAPGGAVTTLAGSGAAGSADAATGINATFDGPSGLVFNAATGTLYVADTYNSTIRAIDMKSGAVTTVAGVAGQPYNSDGTGSTARFNTPEALALDSAGLVYVADTGNNTVRVFDPVSKSVSTVIGDPNNAGSSDGASGVARMNGPAGIAIDMHGDGTVYIIDTNNNSVRSLIAGPVIVTPLRDRVVRTRTSATFDGTAWGSPAPAYRWLKEGAAITGATTANHTIDYVKEADAGTYTVVATNSVGESASSLNLTVTGKDYDIPADESGPSGSGGGAHGAWYLGALAALALVRHVQQRKMRR